MFRKYFEEKEKNSKVMTTIAVVSAVVATAASAFVVYKTVKNKFKITPEHPRMLGRITIDGEKAIMLDTTGNGEVDTIIIDEE